MIPKTDATTAAGQWMLPSERAEAQRTGVWWDALRIADSLGERTLHLLGGASGAVIGHYGALYWLVDVGAAYGWNTRYASIVRTTEMQVGYIAVPPLRFTEGPGPHWRVPPLPGEYLTEAVFLREALRAAIRAEHAGQTEVTQ